MTIFAASTYANTTKTSANGRTVVFAVVVSGRQAVTNSLQPNLTKYYDHLSLNFAK